MYKYYKDRLCCSVGECLRDLDLEYSVDNDL
jgi:hypothetical protein